MYVPVCLASNGILAKLGRTSESDGVSFEEAVTAFSDDEALLLDDPDHSTEEERFVLLGLSGALRLLTVVHCYRVDDEVIRVISARRATRSERVQYGARWIQ